MTDETNQPDVVSEEVIQQRVREAVAKALDLEIDDVQLTSSLEADLGAESLDFLDIAFTLEREFQIQLPRMDLLERASEHFGEDTLVHDGIVTDFGLDLVRRGMPEIDPERLQPGTRAIEITRMITVQTFVRLVTRLLEAKAAFPRVCEQCGATMEESAVTPELVCPNCGAIRPFPSGDAILFQDLLALVGEDERVSE